jgi:hypothetical protein
MLRRTVANVACVRDNRIAKNLSLFISLSHARVSHSSHTVQAVDRGGLESLSAWTKCPSGPAESWGTAFLGIPHARLLRSGPQ